MRGLSCSYQAEGTSIAAITSLQSYVFSLFSEELRAYVFFLGLNQSIPLVPWYVEQEQCLNCPAFILLLHKMGLHLAGDAGKLFPRVPHFWAADLLFQTAENLGPVNAGKLNILVVFFLF